MGEAVIARYPPEDGQEWDSQCARCGSSVTMYDALCLSSSAWCETHPMPGRENVRRGEVEWFVVRPPPHSGDKSGGGGG